MKAESALTAANQELASALQVVEAAKAVERASHVSEKAIANAMAGLRVRLEAFDR